MIYGAADFIVKPLKEKELGDALVRAKNSLREIRRKVTCSKNKTAYCS